MQSLYDGKRNDTIQQFDFVDLKKMMRAAVTADRTMAKCGKAGLGWLTFLDDRAMEIQLDFFLLHGGFERYDTKDALMRYMVEVQ